MGKDEYNNIGYFLEVDIHCPEELHELHNAVPFLPEQMQIGKIERRLANLYDKNEYIIQMINLKI